MGIDNIQCSQATRAYWFGSVGNNTKSICIDEFECDSITFEKYMKTVVEDKFCIELNRLTRFKRIIDFKLNVELFEKCKENLIYYQFQRKKREKRLLRYSLSLSLLS